MTPDQTGRRRVAHNAIYVDTSTHLRVTERSHLLRQES